MKEMVQKRVNQHYSINKIKYVEMFFKQMSELANVQTLFILAWKFG